MATPKRSFPPNSIHHVYNRGNQKMEIFQCKRDYEFFLEKVKKYQAKQGIEIIAYCLMPNHFHLLLREPLVKTQRSYYKSATESFMHRLQTSFAKRFCAINQNYSGKVFQGHYKSKYVKDEKYYLTLKAYIEKNPVRAKLVETAEEWPYSSPAG